MDLTPDDILILSDLYFNKKNVLYQLQYNHFNECLEETIPKILKESENIFFENITNNNIYKYKFIFEDIAIKPPIIPGKDEYMFPEDARKNNYTYAANIEATVKQVQETININTNEKTTKVIGDIEKEHPIASIPIMIKSNYCNTQIKKDIKNTECEYDPGCYFIVKGNEKVIIGMERMCDNKILIFKKKDVNFKKKYQVYATINSKKTNYTEMIQTFNVKMKKDETIYIETPHFNDVPLVILIRALGIISDKEIVDYITNNINDTNMINIIRKSLNVCNVCDSSDIINIKEQEHAITYLISKIKRFKKISDTNDFIKNEQKKMYIFNTLKEDVLPHMGSNLLNKGIYICQVVKKLLNVYLDRLEPDDRDNYVNKRVDTPGILIGQLFKQYYKKMFNDINKFFEKKYNFDNENPINVINQIRPSIIGQGLINGLSTGVWGIQKTRKGVSQALQRYSYLQTISYFRRIVTPSMDSSTQKVVSIRHARNNQYGFLDLLETPEGSKIGLQKHLALLADITINMESQEELIKDLIKDILIDIKNIHPYDYNNNHKVFINGKWLGFCKDKLNFIDFLNEKKNINYINKYVSIIDDIYTNEIKIYTDGGRMIRPLLKVKDNSLILTKDMLNDINLKGDNNKIKDWNLFLLKYKNVIEYIDVEHSEYLLIAMKLKYLNENKKKMTTIIDKPNKSGDKINRYNDTVYLNYTHCELHPLMMLGSSSSCIPFSNHNQAPRNIYSFSQCKQGKGIYATNERHRMDISYRLANPSYPLVQTRAMRYLNTSTLPNGENVIIAIACYTGYNQEDSIIFNKSSLDRGLFRSYVLKKYTDEIKKNPSTSQDDKFTKPDQSKVSGIRKANYNKLNMSGYLEKETKIENGDVIIGKISPIDPGTDSQAKIYKDTSQVYKSNVPAHIDKVYTGLYNSDGYEMYTVQVRSERTPRIGDKFASRHGQKGTCGIVLPASDMPFSKDGIQPDLIMNPNAIPSRMTIGQLLECVLGKVSALRGHLSDGTPFNDYDISEFTDILKSYGFNENGYEELYCGITGKKIKSKIFIGPTFYMRLKHLVQDKIHARARGPRQVLTRQPPEGRARDGGLRFGEMERDCMIAHGMGQFLKERLVNTSDQYFVHVCSNCGLFARKKPDKNIYICQLCNNRNDSYTTHKIEIPYAFKLLIQELSAINILPKIKVNTDIYNEQPSTYI